MGQKLNTDHLPEHGDDFIFILIAFHKTVNILPVFELNNMINYEMYLCLFVDLSFHSN